MNFKLSIHHAFYSYCTFMSEMIGKLILLWSITFYLTQFFFYRLPNSWTQGLFSKEKWMKLESMLKTVSQHWSLSGNIIRHIFFFLRIRQLNTCIGSTNLIQLSLSCNQEKNTVLWLFLHRMLHHWRGMCCILTRPLNTFLLGTIML